MLRALVISGCLLARASAPAGAGLWFDIGGGQPVTVYANSSINTMEHYAAYAFGPFPLGSLVYEDINIVPCESLGNSEGMCGETLFIRGFHCEFAGVSCGCQGALHVPTTMQFDYSPLMVLATGAHEADLKLLFRDEDLQNWQRVPDAVHDTTAHTFTISWNRNVLGIREFAIMTQDITPVAADSWGRIKVLYRR
jgi:hypothetical protein